MTDVEGDEDSVETIAVIRQPNRPPSLPIVSGVSSGSINVSYLFSAVSVDLDGDNLSYVFSWNDGTNDSTTDFLANNTVVNMSYSWTSAGVYLVKVYATDNYTTSEIKEIMVLIDVSVIFLDDEITGYLIDYEKDGTYEMFHNNSTGQDSNVGLEDGMYLIDSDGDGEYDYFYDPGSGELRGYSAGQTSAAEDYTIPIILVIIVVIVIIMFIAIARLRKSPVRTGKKPFEKIRTRKK